MVRTPESRLRASMSPWYRAMTSAVLVLALTTSTAMPLAAQRVRMNATVRVGFATAADDYAETCGAESLAYTVEVQGRRRWFPQLTLDKFSGSGGATTACSFEGTTTGGLQLDGSTRVGVGAGARVGHGWVQAEGAVLVGALNGRHGFTPGRAEPRRVTLPHVGGQVSVVLFRYGVLTGAYHRTRLSFDLDPSIGRGTTRSAWAPMYTWQFGARVPLGARGGA